MYPIVVRNPMLACTWLADTIFLYFLLHDCISSWPASICKSEPQNPKVQEGGGGGNMCFHTQKPPGRQCKVRGTPHYLTVLTACCYQILAPLFPACEPPRRHLRKFWSAKQHVASCPQLYSPQTTCIEHSILTCTRAGGGQLPIFGRLLVLSFLLSILTPHVSLGSYKLQGLKAGGHWLVPPNIDKGTLIYSCGHWLVLYRSKTSLNSMRWSDLPRLPENNSSTTSGSKRTYWWCHQVVR